jgi:hypothetical protein
MCHAGNYLHCIFLSKIDFIPKRSKSRGIKRHLHTHVHSSTTHSSYRGVATPVALDGRMDKPNVVCTYNHIQPKTGRRSDTGYVMGEP